MGYFTLLLIALGLSADAFAVSITNGICSSKVNKINAFLTGITFGFFQALMPVLGFFLGRTFFEVIHRYQHWAAFLLLCAIGINMLVDAKKELHSQNISEVTNVFTAKSLMLQGTITSIDAMAAGISFAALEIHIITAVLIIGMITFILCFTGVYIGRICGNLLGIRAKFVGGITLMLIGLKIFIEAYL